MSRQIGVFSQDRLAHAIRFLSVDAVQKANSGHPGMPMGMADLATVLWRQFLKHNPKNPQWINRDRFVLSNGHGAMLHYALLHLSGYDLSIDDLKAFRQLHSKTPGHPEYGITPGVETTTGPLGQGLANAVGMAVAAKRFAATFNQPDFPLIDHFIYCFVGDGCLMEGISHEVSSLAGTLGLEKLIVFWDDNGISIDGKVQPWFSEDVPSRFRSYGFQVIADLDGHDPNQMAQAIQQAQEDNTRPSLLCCKTTIGFGAPTLAGSEKTHGAPLGTDEIARMRSDLNWPYAPFEIPVEVYQAFDAVDRGQAQEAQWQTLFLAYQKAYPAQAKALQDRLNKVISASCFKALEEGCTAKQSIATRKASQQVLEKLVPQLPALLGGSADLSGSNLTYTAASKPIVKNDFSGNYLHYGVREFGMSAMMNGIALSGGHIPYGGTFLVFSDYAKNAIRLSALMRQQVIYVLTHDSIGLGEDGPTHQPIEQLTMLRAMPNVRVWRPSDATETAVAWRAALQHQTGPTILALSRQGVLQHTRTALQDQSIEKGGYILKPAIEKRPLDCLLIATGSEVALAMAVAKQLEEKQGDGVQVVSMPCLEVFLEQSKAYQESVLPHAIKNRIVIEAGSTGYWYQIAGLEGQVFGLDDFGLSAPYDAIFQAKGLSCEGIYQCLMRRRGVEHGDKNCD